MIGDGGAEASLQIPQPKPARIIKPPIMVRALERAAALFVKYDLLTGGHAPAAESARCRIPEYVL